MGITGAKKKILLQANKVFTLCGLSTSFMRISYLLGANVLLTISIIAYPGKPF